MAAISTPGMQKPHWGTPVPDERLLQRVQGACPSAQPLDGADRAAARLHGQHQAARDRLAVEVDGAGAAVAGAAAFLGSGQAQVLAQRIEQRHVGLDEHLDGLAVDGAAQDCLATGDLLPDQALARSSAVVSVRRVRTRTR